MREAIIAQKSPLLEELDAGKSYFWCACGRSKSQPFATVHTKARDFHRSNTRPLSRRKYFSVVVSKRETRHSVTGRTKVSSPNVLPLWSAALCSPLAIDRLRDFLPDRMSNCRGAHGWARSARSEIHKVIPLTQKFPQAIKSLSDLTQQLMKHSGEPQK